VPVSTSVAPLPREPGPAPARARLRAVRRTRTVLRVTRIDAGIVVATLGLLVVLNVADLGTHGWHFRPPAVEPTGPLAPIVRAAGAEWDLGAIRGPALLAGVLVAVAAAKGGLTRKWRATSALALVLAVVALLILPAVLLQVGLRQSTAPWFFTNDSTYQIELAGDLVASGETPYGHDYRGSGLERFYRLDGTTPKRAGERAALDHLAYFPGTPLSAAAWGALPAPLDDYRIFVLLATLGVVFAVLVFDAPLAWRLAIGTAIAASPLAVKAAWFGTADAPSLLFLLLSFALLSRQRYVGGAASLAIAVLLKQFALVAVPFFVVMLLVSRVGRPVLFRALGAFGGILAAGFLPFLVADARALWADTIAYGADTYPIMGYGLPAFLRRAGLLEGRHADYPVALAVLAVWLPVTAWLLWNQIRSRAAWVGAAGFAGSIFLLLFVGRVFHSSYLIWPLAGVAIAALLAAGPRGELEHREARSPISAVE
jgi:hypothetical protein